MSNGTTYTIDPVFKMPTQFWSTDMAHNVLDDVSDPNVIARANEVFRESMTLTRDVNDLDNMKGFFIEYILLGKKTAKGYPAAILPGVMRSYGINWRDFIHEYGGGDKGAEDRTRVNIVKTALWVAAAYWLTPDWLYNANYIELINYRRWLHPKVLPYQSWAAPIRANPCLFEEGIRQAMQPWLDKVLHPLVQQRRKWALKNFGPGRHPRDVKLAIPAVFYLNIYDGTLKRWYSQAQTAWTDTPGGPPIVAEVPRRVAQRRVSQKRRNEQQGSRKSPNKPQSQGPRETHGNSGAMVKAGQTRDRAEREHRKRQPLPQDSAPTGGNSYAVDWSTIKVHDKTPAQWVDAVLDAGLRDKLLGYKQQDRFGILLNAFHTAGGDRPQFKEEIRALMSRVEAIPATGTVQDEQEYAQLQADHEAVKDTLRHDYEGPREPEPEPRSMYESDPGLTEEELEQEREYPGQQKASVPPPDGGQPFPPVGVN